MLPESLKFEYLQRAAAAQYGLTWIDIQMRLKDGAMGIIDPTKHSYLLTVLAYKACQYFRPKEPHHLGILNKLERNSREALENIKSSRWSERCAEEAAYRAKEATHNARLVLAVLNEEAGTP